MIPDLEKVQRGTQLIKTGWLREMRQATGISRNHLATLLQSHGNHVRRWESGGDPEDGGIRWVHHQSALRVATLHEDYAMAQAWLEAENLTWGDLIALRVASYRMGIAPATLRRRMILNAIDIIDLGILGEWLTKDEASRCRT
jgi:transcriptional regulator with XRE-family HTH domain